MLMRYATHLANGYGIVWNIGEKPVDGASDLLFMVMVAGLIKAGLSAEIAARTLIFLAHVANVLLVYFALRSLWGAPWWFAVVPSFFLAVATGVTYITTCFGAPVFALFASLSWFFALRAVLWDNSFANAFGFGFFSLITGLIRPEGVILTHSNHFILSQGTAECFATGNSVGSFCDRVRWSLFPVALALLRVSSTQPFLQKGRRNAPLGRTSLFLLHVAEIQSAISSSLHWRVTFQRCASPLDRAFNSAFRLCDGFHSDFE
jgi:hypothetical protein